MRSVAIEVKAELSLLAKKSYGAPFNQWMMASLSARLEGSPLRAYFTRMTADYALQLLPAWKKTRWSKPAQQRLLSIQLPLLFEGAIAVQYLHNQILDAKAGITDRAAINNNLLTANLLKDALYDYIEREIPNAYAGLVRLALRRTFEWVDAGQRLETQANTLQAFREGQACADTFEAMMPACTADLGAARLFIDKVKRDLPPLYQGAAEAYFQRIYLTCAALFVEAAALVAALTGLPQSSARRLKDFAVCYGLMRQLVNDNADWLPASHALDTQTRRADDAFSDLRNGVLTLPLIFYLADGHRGPVYAALQPQGFAAAGQQQLFDDILGANALYKSIQNARILGELAISCLDTQQLPARRLAETCEIVHWNKFLAPCLRHPAYQTYRKTTYHRKTKALIQSIQAQRQHVQQPAAAPALSWARVAQWLGLGAARAAFPDETYAFRLLRQ
jgi:geranylgeranyl pyrophosphate synthase